MRFVYDDCNNQKLKWFIGIVSNFVFYFCLFDYSYILKQSGKFKLSIYAQIIFKLYSNPGLFDLIYFLLECFRIYSIFSLFFSLARWILKTWKPPRYLRQLFAQWKQSLPVTCFLINCFSFVIIWNII